MRFFWRRSAGRTLFFWTITKPANLQKKEGLTVLGTIGLLEAFHVRGHLPDLGAAFRKLLTENAYIDKRLLDRRLKLLGLPAL